MAGKVSKKLRRQTETLGQAIGAVVTKLRIEKDWSQQQLATKSGYSIGWVNQLEKGKINPTLELVVALADTFKLTLSQFFARAERQHSKRLPSTPAYTKSKK